MRHLVIPVLLLSLMAGCSGVGLRPYRIDVQQGNVLDQESVARLKPGLSRSQVRFLLGTPLLTDPFRNDRWDYVYVLHKAGKLSEQKHISLFFDGDILTRIEGDVPATEQTTATGPAPTLQAPGAAPAAVSVAVPAPSAAEAAPVAATEASGSEPARPPEPATGGAAAPVAPADVDQHTPAELRLKPETDVMKMQPDEAPAFPQPHPAASADDAGVLKSMDEWASAWRNRDSEAYLAAYDARFVPQGGGSREAWAERKRQTLAAAGRIDLKIESPSVKRTGEGAATVTFKQYYRSGSYHDAVVKRLRMVKRDGRWLIVGEKILSKLPGGRP